MIDLKTRINSLQREHEAGRAALADLEDKAGRVREQLLRIEGAAHLLRELIAEQDGKLTFRPEVSHSTTSSPTVS